MHNRIRKSLTLLPALLLLAGGANAQIFTGAVSPFTVIGFIQKATIDTPGDAFSGGKLTVNGHIITIPRNTILQMPAATMTWGEVFLNAPAAYKTANQSGLALSDLPVPLTTYEVTVYGNRVGPGTPTDQYIAGLVFISQQSLNSGQGYINFINYATGEMRVGGVINSSTTGARVQLNDPLGRFGKAHTPDARLTIDEDNPTVRSTTGFPMCVARVAPPTVDALCPQTNRPKDAAGNFTPIFTFPLPATGVTPDARQQMPFEVGDFVTFAGSLFADAAGQYISAYSVIADIGAFTWTNTLPAYVAIDTLLMGTGGAPDPLLPQEAVEKLVAIGFTTDSTQLVDIFAMDVNACTGVETDRYYTTDDPSGPPIGAVKGRWKSRITVGNFLPPTREIRAVSRTLNQGNFGFNFATATKYANGLIAGQYHAPDFTFKFPENLVAGGPMVPLNFQDFPFLRDGSGPYTASNGQTATVGQLAPWPGNPAVPAACNGPFGETKAPIPNAGANQTVPSGSLVTLNGSASSDPNSPPLPLISWTWVQVGGPSVTLSDPTVSNPTFTAPIIATGKPPAFIQFQMTVTNGIVSSGVASTQVTVQPQGAPPPVKDVVTITSNIWRFAGSRLSVTATSSDTTGAAVLDMTIPNFAPIGMTNAGGGTYTAVVNTPFPSSVTITSSEGGTATGLPTTK
jgi:hypothetical protein